MKTIIAALMLALSLQAFAGEIVVFDASSHELRGISDVKKKNLLSTKNLVMLGLT